MTRQEAERILDGLVGTGKYMIQPRGGIWIWYEFDGFNFPHSNWIYLGNMEDGDIQQMLDDCAEWLKEKGVGDGDNG